MRDLRTYLRGTSERLSSRYRDPDLTNRLLNRVADILDAERLPIVGKPRLPLKRKLAAQHHLKRHI